MKLLSILSIFFVMTTMSWAGDISWSGRYRVEGQYLHNIEVKSGGGSSSYLNHHLILNPEIAAADGLNIHTRFDIFNNDQYKNSQFGEFFGGHDTTPKNRAASGDVDEGILSVTDLYLTWNQQYGSFLAGRAPVQFGLGITHNAGNGEFDHWYDRRDMLAYKFVLGNFYFMPMYGKVKEGDPLADEDIQDYMLQAVYENLDTDLELGFFAQKRTAHGSGNDVDTTIPVYNQALSANKGAVAITTMNLFVKKKTGRVTVAVEGSMQRGSTGLHTTGGDSIDLAGTAIVGEVSYQKESSRWKWNVKLGTVSGDDQSTTRYEGYLLNRNYDVAMILFNYVLGAPTQNVLGSENYIRAITNSTGKNPNVDAGQVSNTLYFAPGFQWQWNDRWGMNGRLTYASLNKAVNGQSKSLGTEMDLGIYYQPYERFQIRADAGYLWTGAAYDIPGSAAKNAYGVMTKAAVSF